MLHFPYIALFAGLSGMSQRQEPTVGYLSESILDGVRRRKGGQKCR